MVLGFQTNGDFFCSVFVPRTGRFFFKSIRKENTSIRSVMINLPFEESDMDAESGDDDETFSSK